MKLVSHQRDALIRFRSFGKRTFDLDVLRGLIVIRWGQVGEPHAELKLGRLCLWWHSGHAFGIHVGRRWRWSL